MIEPGRYGMSETQRFGTRCKVVSLPVEYGPARYSNPQAGLNQAASQTEQRASAPAQAKQQHNAGS
jgi:hypothetical protein